VSTELQERQESTKDEILTHKSLTSANASASCHIMYSHTLKIHYKINIHHYTNSAQTKVHPLAHCHNSL